MAAAEREETRITGGGLQLVKAWPVEFVVAEGGDTGNFLWNPFDHMV